MRCNEAFYCSAVGSGYFNKHISANMTPSPMPPQNDVQALTHYQALDRS